MTNIDALTQGIKNYLKMESSGALLLTGSWGCGKTYYVKNKLFPILEQGDDGGDMYIPIMVSLFGLEDVAELSKRLVTEYLDYNAEKEVHESFHFGKIVEWGSKIAESCPKFNEWIDVSKILGEGTALYRILPKNVVIFLDDLERVVEDSKSINKLLGIVNELVENRYFKVVIIANKGHLDRLTQAKNEHQDEELFYEKVIEKSLTFVPDMVAIFKKLVERLADGDFTSFMANEKVIETINPSNVKNSVQMERLCNIRTLKFAINHMYRIFSMFKAKGANLTDDSNVVQLVNLWVFVHGLSIEYKHNCITVDNNQGLADYSPIATFDIDFGDDSKNEVFTDVEPNEGDAIKIDTSFAPSFYKRYYQDLEINYIFYPQVYKFVLGGIDFDSEELVAFATQENKKFEPHVNMAQDVLDLMLRGFWQFSDETVKENLRTILIAVEDGTLRDTASIYNASVYLLKFCNLIERDEESILESFKTGIHKFIEKHSVTPLDKQTFMMLPIQKGSICDKVYDMVVSEIDDKLNDYEVEEQNTLLSLFKSDVEQFVLELIPNNRIAPSYANTPILHTIPKEVIVEIVPFLQPPDIMNLDMMVRQRPTILQDAIRTELSFFRDMQEELQKRRDDNTMSAFVIREYLLKNIERLISNYQDRNE